MTGIKYLLAQVYDLKKTTKKKFKNDDSKEV